MLAFLLVAGSFTTFRRRRLASPTSIVRNRSHAPPCQVPRRCVSVGATAQLYRRWKRSWQGLHSHSAQDTLNRVFGGFSWPVAAAILSPSPALEYYAYNNLIQTIDKGETKIAVERAPGARESTVSIALPAARCNRQ